MNTATHPLHLGGTPRRQFLAGTIWLPMLGVFVLTAATTAGIVWVITVKENGQPGLSARAMDWLLVVGLAAGAVAFLSAARCRTHAWWSVNPTLANRDHVPSWITGVQSLISLTPLVAGATIVVTHTGLLTYMLGVVLTATWVSLIVLPHMTDSLMRTIGRLSTHGKETVPRRPLQLQKNLAGLVIIAIMWAIPAAAGSPVWTGFPTSVAQQSALLGLGIAVAYTFLAEVFRSFWALTSTAKNETATA